MCDVKNLQECLLKRAGGTFDSVGGTFDGVGEGCCSKRERFAVTLVEQDFFRKKSLFHIFLGNDQLTSAAVFTDFQILWRIYNCVLFLPRMGVA